VAWLPTLSALIYIPVGYSNIRYLLRTMMRARSALPARARLPAVATAPPPPQQPIYRVPEEKLNREILRVLCGRKAKRSCGGWSNARLHLTLIRVPCAWVLSGTGRGDRKEGEEGWREDKGVKPRCVDVGKRRL
jgi:hypothetical protein